MEALTILERDYEDELTASQVIDREAIEKALEEDAQSDDDADTDRIKRKA